MADSLQIYDTLKTALPEIEARAVTKAFEISQFETDSKSDLTLLRSDMVLLKKELQAEIRVACAQLEARLLRWMFLFWIGQVGVTVTAILAAVQLLKK